MEGILGSILLLSLISLTYANTSPTIQETTYHLCEDIPPGGEAFIIHATDAEDDVLTYSLIGPNARYFSVGKHDGTVTVANPLNIPDSFQMRLGVEVSDGPNTTPKELILIFKEANNNPPIFQEGSYDKVIAENTAVGATLFKVKAVDEDTGTAGVINYSIDQVTPNEGSSVFSIDAAGNVKLAESLNYASLSSFYRLRINATDGGGKCHYAQINYFSSVVYSFITVEDVADLDPKFLGVPYLGRVEENSLVDKFVFKVIALDQDIGINDVINYSIENSTAAGLFKISKDEGIISVMSPIDRELVGDTVTLTVKATESNPNIHGTLASTTADVLISIIDVNDNEPAFYKCDGSRDSCVPASHFTGEVLEHALGAISINMTVKDPDKISRTKLILEGNDKDVFSVEPQFTSSDSIVQLLVKQPKLLDFEEIQQIVLQVVAIDEDKPTFSTTATVTISIKDANDNSPTFPHDTYKLNVSEHSPDGTIVAKITAEDPDTMDQGNITYRLLPESIRLYFDVKPQTGSIYVKNMTLLDREVRSLYSATLEAIDTGGKPGNTVLEITVTDINDQKPVFNRESYLAFVEEGGKLEVKIEATDADDSDTENSQIVYGIMQSRFSDNFTINPNTGVLTNRGELDREDLDPKLNGRIELNVTATDKGTPPLSSVVPVIINVEDINDNVPLFEASSYNFSVKEGERGAYVGSVYAEDLDQTTDFNRISFSIIEGSFGSFIIRTFADERGYRGNITVDPDIELDYESTRKQFRLRVEAIDLEQKTAVTTVEVYVLDVNDERPEFTPTGPVTVKENTTVSGAIGSFTGQDKDGNHSLVYELESIKCRCNGSLIPCNWFILDPTGEVRLNLSYTVDYEQCDQAVIEALVVDEFTEKGENNSVTTGELVINIVDINDNAPEFIPSDSVFVVVSESASKGTSVAGVTAIDGDSGVNRQIDFKVTAVQFEDTNNLTTNMRLLFEAVTTQQKDIYVGIIQTTEGLEMSLKGKYLVTVTATDTGGMSSNTVLEIFSVDESYKVELQFTRTVEQVEQDRDKIIRSLTTATNAAVEVVLIRPETEDTSRASPITVMVAYFVYSNGTALTSNEVERMVSGPEHYPVLADLGLRYIGQPPTTVVAVDTVKYVLFGMVGGLIIVLGILTTSLMCTRRNYGRKLKAAKAMNSASMMTSDNQKGGAVVPGTNKYTMEGANPVLNLHMVLDLDEESSDVDKVSLNSLDLTEDMGLPGNHIKTNMLMIEEEEEEEEEYSGPPEYIEPLGAALAQRGQKRDQPHVGYSNPVFSTTDL
ncbi:cadherin-related family member 2 [Pleuronectes platessa]|uniref:cadherin-related family member 2 n=1 Tax=Pleuronectes platessa TaxID=8262 RepID=UPI00232A4EC5|nr:cadherin-related family member 2 [Pleuronectes platessa]XP_053285354.1 cadherin-related family member 2 [Pleuronectes platessa]XP_053285355.1 cadherin-related family member 2 [Pleuronectes platessa]XP_053285356.1 cadherin-related family member 2 [Pleuronectes platessa]XP_053285357.1 cadherin-related family member 2 [Pleuronectes platessa]XP_053285358.1 cadherin-related family member 2 [Pleuronectes platessa]